MTTLIDAKPAKGASSQMLAAIHKMLANTYTSNHPEFMADDTDKWAGIRIDTDSQGRNIYTVYWEMGAPFEWAPKATMGSNIWAEDFYSDAQEFGSELDRTPTFKMADDRKWWAECENSYCVSFGN